VNRLSSQSWGIEKEEKRERRGETPSSSLLVNSEETG